MGESQAGGESSHKRSARPFDPVAGMRAMAEVQAEGLRAAGELIERMLRSESEGPGPRAASPAIDYGPLVQAWADLLRRAVEGLAPPGRPGTVTVPIDFEGVGPQLRLTAPASGDREDAVAEVWLHNGTSRGVGPLVLRCSPLADADGNELDSAQVRFEPRELELLEARSSRAVAVSLATGAALAPGIYRGTIQAHGAPALWLPLEVVIEPC